MVKIDRGITARGGERFELRGRFLAHVAELEWMGRLIVARHLSGSDDPDPRFRILYEGLLSRASFTTLAALVQGIVRAEAAPVIEAWSWLPRDLRLLADKRNKVAHIPAPWLSAEDPLADAESLLALLMKVDAGLAHFGSYHLAETLDFSTEADFTAHGREQSAVALRSLRTGRDGDVS